MATVASTPRTNRITLAFPTAGPFEVGFRLFESDALKIYVDGIVSTDYTVAATFNAGYDDNAAITFGSELDTATVIQIDGDLTPARNADYLNGPGLVAAMNIELARMWSSISEVRRLAKTAVRSLDEQEPVDGLDASVLQGLEDALSEAETAATTAGNAAIAAAASAATAAANAALLGIWRGPWVTATIYAAGDRVSNSGNSYYAISAHTSAALFSTDLSGGKWGILAEKGAAGAGTGDVVAANNGSDFPNKPLTLATLGGQPVNASLTSWAGITRAANFDAFVATPTSASLRALLTDEVGTGAAYFVGGALGTPASGNLVNMTGLTTAGIASAALVDEADDIASNDNDSTIPTSAAAKDYSDRTGRVPLASKTASNTATLDFTEFDNAIYDRYEFDFDGLVPITDATALVCRFSSNGGSSYDSGGTDYRNAALSWNNAGFSGFASNASYAYLTPVDVGNGAVDPEFGVSGKMRLMSASLTAVRTRGLTDLSYENNGAALSLCRSTFTRAFGQDTDAIRFMFLSGNIALGTIRMYGIRA